MAFYRTLEEVSKRDENIVNRGIADEIRFSSSLLDIFCFSTAKITDAIKFNLSGSAEYRNDGNVVPKIYDDKKRMLSLSVKHHVKHFENLFINGEYEPQLGIKEFINQYSPEQKQKATEKPLEQIEGMIDGGATHILCNVETLQKLQRDYRDTLKCTVDSIGRTYNVFGKSKLIYIDAISDHENEDGADGDLSDARYTSIYGLRIDEGYFDPFQKDSIKTIEHGLCDGNISKTSFDWVIGYRIHRTKSIAHVYGFPLEG